MTACMLWCCLSASVASAPAPEEPGAPKPVVLLAGSDEYKKAEGTEAVYEGVVENNPGDGTVGKPTRFNAYRLKGKDAAGKDFVRELYVPGKAFLLGSYVGKRVRVTGKFADTTADGKVYPELWPAQLEEVMAVVVAPPLATDGVLARCVWQPDEARRIGQRVFTYRNGRDLARALRLSGDATDETATTVLAQKLGTRAIDWDKQMLVTVSAGLRGADVDRVTVTRVEVKDKTLTVFYQLPGKPGAAGFGYPAETVLVDHFDGVVRAEEEPAAPPKDPAK